MFTSVFKYAYPHAKVRAMKGLLLSEEHYHALLNAETFEHIVHVLQTTHYADAMRHVSENEGLSPQLLTDLLYRSLFSDCEKTIQAIDVSIRDFFTIYYQKYELINLKTILRGLISHVPQEQIAPLLLPTARYTLFSKKTLLEFNDVHAIIEHLQGTFFAYPLNLALRRYEEEQEFFPLEMALDLHYYQTLWAAVKKLPDSERHIAEHIIGTMLDILNITWIIRFKEEYRFSPEEILNYTIEHGHVFRLAERRKFSEAAHSGEMIDILKTTPYGRALSGEVALPTLHVLLNRYLIGQLRRFFAGNPFQIGVILGYWLLKEFEIADIITIAEAKKYGFSFEQSQCYVVHTKPI